MIVMIVMLYELDSLFRPTSSRSADCANYAALTYFLSMRLETATLVAAEWNLTFQDFMEQLARGYQHVFGLYCNDCNVS